MKLSEEKLSDWVRSEVEVVERRFPGEGIQTSWVKGVVVSEIAKLEARLETLEFWQKWVFPDGANPDAIQQELIDFHTVITEVAKVYDNLTNGRISKPTTRAEVVIAEVEYVFAAALPEHLR